VTHLWKNKALFSLLGANNFSALGDALYVITTSWYISDTFHSGSLMGSTFLVMGIVQFMFGVIGGGITDRFGPKKVMILSDAADVFS
jgi:MFS family permease